jgi:quercetin 2,3-dioxygenase
MNDQSMLQGMENTSSFRIVPTSDLLLEDRGWTRGYAHAAFDEVPRHSPGFLDFPPAQLAVHQTIDAGFGYPMHHHEGIESLMLLLEGACLHEDSTGQRTRLPADTVSVLSAGRGIEHGEFADDSGPLRAVMFWVKDGDPAGEPRFQSRRAARAERLNRFVVLAGDEALPIRQRARLFAAYLEPHRDLTFELAADRRAYLLAPDSAVDVNGALLAPGDRLLVSSGSLAIRARAATEVVILEV